MTKQIALIGIAVLTTLLALLIFWEFRIVVVYLLISLTIAAAVRPLVKPLIGRSIAIRAAWILLYLGVLGGFGIFLFLIGRTAFNEIQQMGQSLSVQNAWTLPAWLDGTTFQPVLTSWLPPPRTIFEAVTGDQGQFILPALLNFTQGFAGMVSAGIVILFLSLYWIINQVHFERLWLSLLPAGQRKQARDIWRTIEPDLGAYIRSQIIHSLLAGVLLGLGYWALGSPYPVLLALAGAAACLIPMVGMPLAMVPVLFVGLLTGVQFSIFSVLFTLVVLIALFIWVKPRLFNRMWDNPILTMVILIALANTFGVLGIIIAPPVSAVCQILWSLLVSHRLALGAAANISDLKERQERTWEIIREMGEPPLPLLTSSMERLNRLILQAEPLLQPVTPVDTTEVLLHAATQPKQEKSDGRAKDT
jgi:putative permease